jgi:radical SAM-linked protein
MSEGFNPRPRISLPMPLSVGMAGASEVADIGLSEWVRPEAFRKRLAAELPEGIGLDSAESTRTRPNRQPAEAAYRIPLLPGHGLTVAKIDEALARPEIVVTRTRKGVATDLEVRRYIKRVRLEGEAVLILVRNTQEGTARPEEVLQALGCRPGIDYNKSEIERVHVNLAS